jgi:hypothetical protein
MTSAFNQDSLPVDSTSFDVEQAQREIYQYFINLVKHQEAEAVLQEFYNLFIYFVVHPENAEVMQYLANIITNNNQRDFIYLIKRCCYILINNWDTKRNHDCIRKLIDTFTEFEFNDRSPSNPIIKRLQTWLKAFKESNDYQDLQLFIRKYETAEATTINTSEPQHWSDRYTSYLLVAQYADPDNPEEQRNAARLLSLQLKNKFKFELAMYATHSQLSRARQFQLKNPTSLGDNVLFLIKKIIVKKGYFNHKNLANIFTKQITGLSYQDFKVALIQYLLFSLDIEKEYKTFARQMKKYILNLYPEYNEEDGDESLILRTSNRIVDYLTKDNNDFPSERFVSLICQGHQLTLAIIFLKLILICPNGRMHLEKRIAELIKYYQKIPETDCEWAIHFFEVFNITFTIYGDNDVEYSLIRTHRAKESSDEDDATLANYHIFSQYRGWPNLNSNRPV